MSSDGQAAPFSLSDALAFQARILDGVSRTFALTIPVLPDRLRISVTNAYLLCRIADTLEDDPDMSVADKRRCAGRFIETLTGTAAPADFVRDTLPRLSRLTPADERELIARTPEVVLVTASLAPAEREALVRCVALMSEGMHRFQQRAGLHGLESLEALDEYCYYVAGVVGEMLTALFCAFSPRIAVRRKRLEALAPSFGQGLQMTNILKDIWEDRARGVCWLPRSVFGASPSGQSDLLADLDDRQVERGLAQLVVVAHGHLRNAIEYTLAIPRRHAGIRRFCLWALGMAVPTLCNIHERPGFRRGDEVKITRDQVRGIVKRYGTMAASDTLIRWQFARDSAPLPASDPGVAAGLEEISRHARAESATTAEERLDTRSVGAN